MRWNYYTFTVPWVDLAFDVPDGPLVPLYDYFYKLRYRGTRRVFRVTVPEGQEWSWLLGDAPPPPGWSFTYREVWIL